MSLPGHTKEYRAPLTGRSFRRARRGQSMIEAALLFPLLLLLFAVLVDAGLALNSWLRVNTAARDATRFVMDAGRPGETVSLVLEKLEGLDAGEINVYIIRGETTPAGALPATSANWNVSHAYGGGPNEPRLQREAIEAGLAVPGNPDASRSLRFAIVEVTMNYSPFLGALLAPGSSLPMSSYALIQLPPQ